MHRAQRAHRRRQAATACDQVCRGMRSCASGHEPWSPVAQSPGPAVVPQCPSWLEASQLDAVELGEGELLAAAAAAEKGREAPHLARGRGRG